MCDTTYVFAVLPLAHATRSYKVSGVAKAAAGKFGTSGKNLGPPKVACLPTPPYLTYIF